MNEKELDYSIFANLAETMMFCGEDGERMCEDILKIKKTITAISPDEKKESGAPEMLDGENAEELRDDSVKDENDGLVEKMNLYKEPYNVVPRVV